MSLNIPLIRESFEALKPHADEAIASFYSTLFEKYPEAQGLFNSVDMEKQKRLLIASLSHIVDSLEDSDHLSDYLRKMGGRHLNYGVEPHHYDWVGEALLETFAFYFAENWTDELREQWVLAFSVVSSTMMEGAEKAMVSTKQKPQKNIPDVARKLVIELFEKALEEEVPRTLQRLARQKVREVLRAVLEEEGRQAIEQIRHHKQNHLDDVA